MPWKSQPRPVYPVQQKPVKAQQPVGGTSKGAMQVLYGFALIFAAAMLGLWFVQSFPSYAGKISYNDVYRMAGSFDATYNYVNYAAIGVMGLTVLFTLLPTLGAGTRSRALVVIPLLFTLRQWPEGYPASGTRILRCRASRTHL